MRSLIFVLLLSTAAFSQVPPITPGVSQELAKWRAAHYSDVRYKLNLTLEKMSPVLKGSMEIRVGVRTLLSASAQGAEIPPIILDWRRIKGHEDKSTISNVSINGISLAKVPAAGPDVAVPSYEEPNEHIVINSGVKLGENVIKLDFTSPILTSGAGITRYIDKEDGSEYIYSLFVPSDASTAFPVFDQPDLKARFSLEIVGPAEWRSVANERAKCENFQSVTAKTVNKVEKPTISNIPPEVKLAMSSPEFASAVRECAQKTADLTHSFAEYPETKPISTYVFAFAAGPFERVSEPPAVAGGLTRSTTNVDKTKTASINANSTDPNGQPPAIAGGSDLEKLREMSKELKEAYDDGKSDTRRWLMKTDELKAFQQPPATAGGSDRNADTPTSIYVRRSQAAKFKPHAAEVFRLNRESIKYFEEYFDYKFPFPKYDLVLIPEFPFGGMEHAGATFLRESAIIFPQEPTKSDHISRAVLIFHEAAHQWFGDTVTMKWFDDLWLKEGFANFMAYKAVDKIMPDANAWKVFYERIKQPAYATDSTRGTTPIYQPIDNLNSAKSAYGNIVYNKAPAFLKQAEFYLGPEKFQTAVRAFLKKHEYKNATWEDLVKEFEIAAAEDLREWSTIWVKQPGLPLVSLPPGNFFINRSVGSVIVKQEFLNNSRWQVKIQPWLERFKALVIFTDGGRQELNIETKAKNEQGVKPIYMLTPSDRRGKIGVAAVLPNYQDYGYGIFLLDDKSREYVLKNVQNEKDAFLRSMMYGALWDSVREGELDPRTYVEVAIKNLPTEQDETIAQMMTSRTATALNYYISDGGNASVNERAKPGIATSGETKVLDANVGTLVNTRVSARNAAFESVLIERIKNAPTLGQRITFYRAFLNTASSESSKQILRDILDSKFQILDLKLKTKDKFDIITRLAVLNDPDAARLLAELERTETTDDAKRYAYAARAAFPTKENREKFWNDFVANKDISESWIEAAVGPFNSVRNSELSLPYLERALKELPNLKRSRKIFFVNNWLGAFIGGQRSEEALASVNKFLTDNPNLDRDLRLKILENVDIIERAVRIRAKFK